MEYYVDRNNEIVEKYTIKDILKDNWNNFVESMAVENKRKTIIDEVEKIIGCQDPKNGFALYACPKCHEVKHVPFTFKSSFCNCCGAKYAKDRSLAMSAKILDCRHLVFTIPEELRKYFAFDRTLLNLLFEAAANTISFCFSKRNKSENYIPGMISTLHTFGRDLKWNPHIHMILCEEAIRNSNTWRKFHHINYEGLRHSWQYSILKLLSEKITDPAFKTLVNKLYVPIINLGSTLIPRQLKNFHPALLTTLPAMLDVPSLRNQESLITMENLLRLITHLMVQMNRFLKLFLFLTSSKN